MNAREDVLGRVRRALDGAAEPPPVPRGYRRSGEANPMGPPDVLARFVERVEDYRATVTRCGPEDVGAAVAAAVVAAIAASSAGPASAGAVLVPRDLEPAWADAIRSHGMEVAVDDPADPLPIAALDAVAAVVTAAAVGIAETGTIVLDGGRGQGRRALTLVPDVHVCVVAAAQVVDGVPEALSRLDPRRPQTWISGPSATSDIELNRVEGVHGPRTLWVVLVDAG